jgi:hypothetical protein
MWRLARRPPQTAAIMQPPDSFEATVNDSPNNFGSLLLIIAGAVSAPIGIGLILLLTGLALLREANGELSFPRLQGWIKLIQMVQFWRINKL